MKLRIWALPLVFLGMLSLFAGSALAQEDEAAPDQGNSTHQLQFPPQFRQAKPPNSSASAAGKTQQQANSDAVSPDVTDTCSYTFTSGSGTTYLKFCVTVNGNIVEFESPSGVEQIRQGTFGEGYGICDMSTNVAYFDYSSDGDSGNWKAPIKVSSTATMVKIERTTTDGLWTITQTITSIAGTNPYAKVLMALKNNSSTPKEAYVLRWADVDPGNADNTDTSFLENFDSTLDSAWGYVPHGSTPAFGLMFQNVGNPVPATVPYERAGFSQYLAEGAAPCDPTGYYESPVTNADGSILYIWLLDLNKEQSASVTGRYISF